MCLQFSLDLVMADFYFISRWTLDFKESILSRTEETALLQKRIYIYIWKKNGRTGTDKERKKTNMDGLHKESKYISKDGLMWT